MSARFSRRRLLGTAGLALGGVAVDRAGGAALAATRAAEPDETSGLVPFHGRHQAGIATPAQDRLLFASYDLTSNRRDDVMALLKAWTAAAERLVVGDQVGEPAATAAAPNTDTGEALGLRPANLTLTFGFGPTLFTHEGLGLADSRPAALIDIPAFPGDLLEAARSGGDLCVQACGDDAQVLFHAIRNLTRMARGTAVVRWIQEGFGRTSSTTSSQVTPRNLMGFKDGTNNLRADHTDFAPNVWATNGEGTPWMVDGSYLVARRIRILIEIWDRSSLTDQEATIGRHRDTGAPLGAADEFAPVDLNAPNPDGTHVTPVDAHVALANQDANAIHVLRRGYNFTDGLDASLGQLDAGLFFLAYQRDPRAQFIPMQDKLARIDALNEYIKHVGSAVFAVPPGIAPGGWIGETLFG